MSTRRSRRLLALQISSVLTALLLLQCSDTTSPTGEGVDVGVEPSSSSIGAGGGTVESGDVSIAVPAGALAEDVEITVESSEIAAEPDGVEVVGPTIEIGPSGTTFAVPATIQVPYVPGTLPTGRTEEDVRIYTADALAGPWTALVTTVDVDNDIASAEVDHLSHFVPGVVQVSTADPVCPEMGDCDCDPVWASRTLDMLGETTVGRRIETMCYDDAEDVLSVLSFTLPDSADPFVDPDQYYLSRFDGSDLTELSDLPTEESTLEGANCTPVKPSRLSGTNEAGDIDWSVHHSDVRESPYGGVDWIHSVLRVNGVYFSFNRHLNEEAPYTDTHSFYDSDNGAAARFLDDGSARFYVHIYHDMHVDVMHIDNLAEILANPTSFEDEHGFVEPSFIERIELEEGSHDFGYKFNPIHVSPAADDPNADIVIAFNRHADLISVYRVHRNSTLGLVVDGLPSPPIVNGLMWGQFGWQNGGLDNRGILYVASNAGSFTNGKIVSLDPTTGELVGDWTIGCIGTAEAEGFMAIPWESGLVLRFSYDVMDDSVRSTMFIRDGRLEAIGQAPFHFAFGNALRLVTSARDGRLYVGDWETGEIAGIAFP